MEPTSSVRVNGLLYSSEFLEFKFYFFSFQSSCLILVNFVLNRLEEFSENVSVRRSAMTFLSVIFCLLWRGDLIGLFVFYQLFSI